MNPNEFDIEDIPIDIFEEPEGFRPPSPKPTMTEFVRHSAFVQDGIS